MQNLIVSDVFGRTPALDSLATSFSVPTEIHDPYASEYLAFEDEKEAYAYFSEHVTLETYAGSLYTRLQASHSPTHLIGFSVGASAIWQMSAQANLSHIMSASCFYGSQIRNHVDINVLFPVKLIFPMSEAHFSVEALMRKLSSKHNVTLQQVPFLHGFMNPHSVNYDRVGYQQAVLALTATERN